MTFSIIRSRKPPNGEIPNTRRVERTLKLIAFLSDWKTVKQCAAKLEVHEKSIHRYFNMLVVLGFTVQSKHGKRNKYRITNITEYFNQ